MRALVVFMLLAGAAQAETIEGRWRVAALEPLVLTEGDSIELTLVEGRISGNAGCNRFSASYTMDTGMVIGPIASTRMLCHGRAGEVEAAVLHALPSVTGWRLVEGALELLAGEAVALRALPIE